MNIIETLQDIEMSIALPCPDPLVEKHFLSKSASRLTSIENALACCFLSRVHSKAVVVLDLHPSTNVSAVVSGARRKPLRRILFSSSANVCLPAQRFHLTWSPLLWFTSSVTASSWGRVRL